ncbi:LuxR C-terminal-related transcriptional regulator [Nonomuraea sp. NPDC005983]|uniref:LuxR C-terminal-related transcriptional regulator n=1 Tax=Nonomuraea sp. NPDC005983 TaxID=3155595 RepID=UPI00339F4FD1
MSLPPTPGHPMTTHVQHNLPAEPNRFVGRARDVAELCALLGQQRVITLCGVGGIGKSRLSLQVAAEVVERFAGGVWLVELARIGKAELIAHRIAEVLGVRDEVPGRVLDGLRARLRQADALLVLDNCEHLVDRCARLVAALMADCPGVRFLLTSREPLRIPGELIWRVPPLELPDEEHPHAESVLLFVDRALAAGARAVTDDMDDIVRLCRALDGLPLALELAAARTSLLSPGRIADRLKNRFQLLTTGDRTAPARQRTLLATVEWSHELLRPKERMLLRRLSVFAGHFDLDLAEQVCADGGMVRACEVLDLLNGLVDKSLVQRHDASGRYHLLETIKQYAVERAREVGEEAWLRDRHLRLICEAQERCFAAGSLAGRMPWPARFAYFGRGRSLLDDCRAAVDWAMESGDAPLGLRLCRATVTILAMRGDLAEAADWLERLLGLDLSQVPPDVVGVAKGGLAYALEARDELARAAELIVESIEEQRRHPYSHWLGVSYTVAVTVFLRTGQGDKAARYLQELDEAATAHDDLFNLATARMAQLNLALFQGQVRQAQRLGEEALALAEESGHRWTIARALTHLGAVAEARGDLEAACAHHTAALPLLRELDNRAELARCLAKLGRVAAQLHDHATARENVAASLVLCRQTGQRREMVRVLVALSVLAQSEGDLDGAVLAAAAASALRESIGQHGNRARTHELLTLARARLGETRVAALWARGLEQHPDEVARRILDRESRPPSPSFAPAPEVRCSALTPREWEIAGLLTRGLSNRAIAAELVISPATVARHVANMMDKLGFASRAQIAVWTAARGFRPGGS